LSVRILDLAEVKDVFIIVWLEHMHVISILLNSLGILSVMISKCMNVAVCMEYSLWIIG